MAYAIREGDPTSTGGFVVSGSATQLVEERRLARMGDPVWCPTCEKVGYIVQGNPTFIDEYIAVATQGHEVQCGCERGTHTLVATQQDLAADMDAAIEIPRDMAEEAKLRAEKMTQARKAEALPGLVTT
jgi:uncharacterized Zn-binding protein involved in type VI secretion